MIKSYPKVSVLMSVYNGSRYLRESIESILNQTFTDFEFIIVDDCSTDNSREIIEEYAQQDQRIILVNNEQNLRLTRSLNKGLKFARGEYVARLDADDISAVERLAKQVAFLDAHPEVALVGTWYKEIDPQGKVIRDYQLPCDCTEIRWSLLYYTPYAHSALMFRRVAVQEQTGFYNEDVIYAQDHEFGTRIASCFQVVNLDEYLIQYRINPSSITLTHGVPQYEAIVQASLAYMRKLVESSQFRDIAIDEALFRNMQVLFGCSQYELSELNSLDLRKTIKDILELQKAFCCYYKISQNEYRERCVSLRLELSDRLLEMACYFFYQQEYKSWPLLIQAFWLHKPAVWTRKYLSLLSQFVLSTPGLSSVRQLIRKYRMRPPIKAI